MISLLAVSLVGGVLIAEDKSSLGLMLSAPICAGYLAGLVLGDPVRGFLAGALFQMIFIGYSPVRGEKLLSVKAASIAGVAIYLLGCRSAGNHSSLHPDILLISILLGVMISGVGDFCYISRENGFWSISGSIARNAVNGKIRRASWFHRAGVLIDFFSGFLFLMVVVGAGHILVIQAAGFITDYTGDMMEGLRALIPFIAVAALLRLHIFTSRIVWFASGFVLTLLVFTVRGWL